MRKEKRKDGGNAKASGRKCSKEEVKRRRRREKPNKTTGLIAESKREREREKKKERKRERKRERNSGRGPSKVGGKKNGEDLCKNCRVKFCNRQEKVGIFVCPSLLKKGCRRWKEKGK